MDDVLGLGVVVEQPPRETDQAGAFSLEGGGPDHGRHILLRCAVRVASDRADWPSPPDD